MMDRQEAEVDESGGHAGFTLIELLIVVLIIGILAAIAIPVLLGQREKAYQDAVVSDIRNAAFVMEDTYTDTAAYPPAGVVPGFLESDGVTVRIAVSNNVGYCIRGFHSNLDRDHDGNLDLWHFDTRVLAASAGIVAGDCPP